MVRPGCGVDQAAADHFPAEKRDHQGKKNHGNTENPSGDPKAGMSRTGEKIEAHIQREQQKDRADDEFVPEDILIICLQHDGMDLFRHDDQHVSREQQGQQDQNVADHKSEGRGRALSFHVFSSADTELSD